MISLSEIDTTVKRATKAIGFSWGIAEEVGKCIRTLEMFGLPGIKNLNQYYKVFANKKFQKCKPYSKIKYIKGILLPYNFWCKFFRSNSYFTKFRRNRI
tara:strand:+ start:233 stop:529 length:297 start_codon:yes stop_codon:yes gene_type:complete